MEEAYTLVWEDGSPVVQNEEVICGIDNDCSILPGESAAFSNVCEEVVVQDNGEPNIVNSGELQAGHIMYVTEDDMMVMQQPSISFEEEQFVEISTEEVVTEPWSENCPEIVVGSEEHVEEQPSDDVEIPIPTDQDQYTAARPYPCDFCCRRFRKKANLMNHMVVHQTDRPHGYIRKCDLMNHLKIHAYFPETDELDEEDSQTMDDSDSEMIVHPYMTVLHRCDSQSGCCDTTTVCKVLTQEAVNLTFRILKNEVNSSGPRESTLTIEAYNHTACSCQAKHADAPLK